MLAAPCSSLLHGEPRAAVGRQAEKQLGMGKESVNTWTYTLHRGSGGGEAGGIAAGCNWLHGGFCCTY